MCMLYTQTSDLCTRSLFSCNYIAEKGVDVFKFCALVLASLVLVVSSGTVSLVNVNDTITLGPCESPEIEGLIKLRWEWYLNNDLIGPDSSPLMTLNESNRSLTVVAQLEDVNHVYGCLWFATLQNGSEIRGDLQSFIISPVTPAFLVRGLRNETVAWGTHYVVPCEAGGIKPTLEIKVNGVVYPRRHLRVVNNTTVECRAFNSAGEEKSFAYLTVTPGSEQEAQLNPPIERPSCKPFPASMTSVCSGVLGAEVPTGSIYQVSTSRLLRVRRTNRLLSLAFHNWDTLLPPGALANSTHARCLQQAKRLVCLLVFPRCQEVEAYIEDFGGFYLEADENLLSIREVPVCQQHCYLVASILCSASFKSPPGTPALMNYTSTSTYGDGWRELLSQTGNATVLLGDVCEDLPRMAIATSANSVWNNLDNRVLAISGSVCQAIDFSALLEDPGSTGNSSKDCYTGQGVLYRGLSHGHPSCLPWAELDFVKTDVIDPLASLSPSVLPAGAFGRLPANQSVCRNPLGLASKPFCVGPDSTGNLSLFYCPFLVDCAAPTFSAPTNHVGLLNRQRVNMIAISSSVCPLFFILLCLILVYIGHVYARENTATSEAEKHERRHSLLVARRARIRETHCLGRWCLRFLYACQDACSGDNRVRQSCCTGKYTEGDLSKGDQQFSVEKALDDEDEEVENCREFLRGRGVDKTVATVAAVLEHAENQPHLTPVPHTDLEPEFNSTTMSPDLPEKQISEKSSTRPSCPSFAEEATSLEAHDKASSAGSRIAKFQLESALRLASVGQLIHPKLKQLSYPRNQLIEERILAKSVFGNVVLARAPKFPFHKALGVGEPCVVIKTLAFGASSATETAFFREAELLVELNHPNIVKILGICIPLQPYSLIYEYMRDGDLSSYLHRLADASAIPSAPSNDLAVALDDSTASSGDDLETGPLSIGELLHFALDVCEAMVYLNSRLYVHRDLATRNCLVDKGVVKLADLAMCRRLPHFRGADLIDREGAAPLAVRWLPMESVLEGRFNWDTDVWSFGVLVWELFTFGRLPYGNVEVSEVIRAVSENMRLQKPRFCPHSVYKLMLRCWSPTRNERPSFRRIRSELAAELQHFQTE
uniref:Protein kinase domain-containing protein n=1 Tax=Mesocestoides corti TaxID=53468 RepID=A0A5K3EWX5_MESCO